VTRASRRRWAVANRDESPPDHKALDPTWRSSNTEESELGCVVEQKRKRKEGIKGRGALGNSSVKLLFSIRWYATGENHSKEEIRVDYLLKNEILLISGDGENCERAVEALREKSGVPHNLFCLVCNRGRRLRLPMKKREGGVGHL